MEEGGIKWNVVDAVSDANFDSSSSLSEGLWGSFKQKISSALAQLLVISDVWRVSDEQTLLLWCEFVEANYPQRLMLLNSADAVVQMPMGFRFCTQPFGRLLVSFDRNYAENAESLMNEPLRWLLDYIDRNADESEVDLKEVRSLINSFLCISFIYCAVSIHFSCISAIGCCSAFLRTFIRALSTCLCRR